MERCNEEVLYYRKDGTPIYKNTDVDDMYRSFDYDAEKTRNEKRIKSFFMDNLEAYKELYLVPENSIELNSKRIKDLEDARKNLEDVHSMLTLDDKKIIDALFVRLEEISQNILKIKTKLEKMQAKEKILKQKYNKTLTKGFNLANKKKYKT